VASLLRIFAEIRRLDRQPEKSHQSDAQRLQSVSAFVPPPRVPPPDIDGQDLTRLGKLESFLKLRRGWCSIFEIDTRGLPSSDSRF